MSDFVMPSLGADMEFGTVLEWTVKPGDTVKRGDIVAVVDTSKAEIEVEIFEDGVIEEVLVPAGARVPVGTVLATVRPVGTMAAPSPSPPEPEPAAGPEPPVSREPAPEAEPAPAPEPEPVVASVHQSYATPHAHNGAVAVQAKPEHRLRISPLARRVAVELGVDIVTVRGSGPNGAITRSDVERAAPARARRRAPKPPPRPTRLQPPAPEAAPPAPEPAPPAPEPAPPAREAAAPTPTPTPTPPHAPEPTPMRIAIGELMARSKREIPHYYLEHEIDLSRALDWLHETNLSRPVPDRLLASALLLSAVAHAVADQPEMNGFWIDGRHDPGTGIHLGVAISLRGGGLIAPALHDADRRSLEEIMRGVRDLVQRARTGRLRSSEMSDPTITVTNLGERGVDLVHGVIYPPQVALVGFGGIRERPWAVDGMLTVRPLTTVTLAADHRASDGHTGSRFLTLIAKKLQSPEEL